ncbi:hypothetical protein D187_004021 [Cystobacter fuscus DSM 2262]|uniref:FBA domain-containing protein n=1 Tax=Cystobacter fuscus (strain ATCC 25194 / DSM 2262 / NBRC 100088 / M29) TaxID=1242864 RepID=S9P1C6_CYSF2|nr:hypothetical protein [Cystobacter fuscus]EPX58265.1 hypothetical protein D187_004021 [Cystobacter fuscus DSM 2262]
MASEIALPAVMRRTSSFSNSAAGARVGRAMMFTGYGPAARYVRWTDGGMDSEWWWGHYGVVMDDAVVAVFR